MQRSCRAARAGCASRSGAAALSTTWLFLGGDLAFAPLLQAVLGRVPRAQPASAPGWRLVALPADATQGTAGLRAALLPDPASEAPGLLLQAQGDDQARLYHYAVAVGVQPWSLAIRPESGPRLQAETVLARLSPEAGVGAEWAGEAFAATRGPLAAAVAQGLLTLWPQPGPAVARQRLPQVLARAASQLRARASATPRGIRKGGGELRILHESRTWRGFFEVAQTRLDFPRFDGSRSGPVLREGFHMADAVTVLPYDPARDRVLLVEQFRFGPMLRGDPLPWTLEPIAGRLDGAESPESCARREAKEEAGLALDRLIPCGRFYPTPGAVSEYIHAFVALADLPDGIAGTHGLPEEHEDIRSHLLPFNQALSMLERGEIETAPLQISLLQLARHRPSLRSG